MSDRVSPADMQVGRNLRRIRREREMSQTDIAVLLGVSFQQVQKYETGRNRVPASKVWSLSLRLGISITEFFRGCG